ncbi:mannitol dehydrogenase family protein [Arenivirga flava]|uniref:Mannitol-1-phosphate 5-dehydrogenase n=1 Tax=Arenivirga flava TaxID=1930060 RepID=A0AA37XB30_9MICO|nr:mannitol dehydrogenase family protein [Arenivirga flava]GMA27915.1 mannitol-1-phosphate 5-dehydrogenase [Arenivirga flava]
MSAALRRERPGPPVRMVHLGLGAFHRAHQAWYTQHADDGADWGIAAFTVRSPDAARVLDAQDGLYTIVTRAADGDTAELGTAIVAAHDGADLESLERYLSDPAVAVVTLTVTEAGYALDADGSPSARLRDDAEADRPATALGRLLRGFDARRRANAGPIAVVCCDNLPENGALLRGALLAVAAEPLRAWIERDVSVVGTSVDRITPAVTDELTAEVERLTGLRDAAPVATEPFSDWVLGGDFPAGRPRWESAGARFVDDLEPWERRKLRLLNGAHTLLALAGPPRGHRTVAEAIADPALRSAVEALWDEASATLPDGLDLPAYRSALLERFANPRIEHRLAQIAQDSLTKLRLRIVPVARHRLAEGASTSGCATAVAAWIAAERPDVAADAALADLDPALAADARFAAEVTDALARSAQAARAG